MDKLHELKEHLDHRFDRLEHRIHELKEIQMADKADLDAAIASENTELATVATDVQTALTDFEAAIAAGKTGVDLSSEVDAVNATVTQLAAIATAAVTADPGAQPTA